MTEMMRAGDPIKIVAYDPVWPERFRELARPMREALGAVALRIDHIGSTAIPGLAAKPIIDMQISVADLEPLDAFRVPLEGLGYIFRPQNPERTKRYFREAPGQGRVHIHVRRAGSFNEQYALLFRGYMRTHPEVAERYAELKMGLARQYGRAEQRTEYTDAKRPFFWRVMERADEWAKELGWFPGASDV